MADYEPTSDGSAAQGGGVAVADRSPSIINLGNVDARVEHASNAEQDPAEKLGGAIQDKFKQYRQSEKLRTAIIEDEPGLEKINLHIKQAESTSGDVTTTSGSSETIKLSSNGRDWVYSRTGSKSVVFKEQELRRRHEEKIELLEMKSGKLTYKLTRKIDGFEASSTQDYDSISDTERTKIDALMQDAVSSLQR